MQPDGSVRPLLPGEEQYPQHRTIVSLYMSMTQEECFQVLVTNMVSGSLLRVTNRQLLYICSDTSLMCSRARRRL